MKQFPGLANTIPFLCGYSKRMRGINFYHKYGFEFDGCKKEWTLGTSVSIVRMIKKVIREKNENGSVT